MSEERPLFVPLKRRYFEAFASGEKTEEFRAYGPRWNERTCRVGRAVVLSLGYGKTRRLRGTVVGFIRERSAFAFAGVSDCYGRDVRDLARIAIKVERGSL